MLAAFFLPYILPVSVVIRVWGWMFDKDFGVAQYLIAPFNDGQRLSIFRTIPLFMPAVALVTIWWLLGFSVLLYIVVREECGAPRILGRFRRLSVFEIARNWA